MELDFELLVAQADQTFEAVPDSRCPSVPAGATTFFGPKISQIHASGCSICRSWSPKQEDNFTLEIRAEIAET